MHNLAFVYKKTVKNVPALATVPQLVGSLSCKLKGHGFNSQSGYMPGLPIRSPIGECIEAVNRCSSLASMFLSPSLSLSLPLPLKSISMSLSEDEKKKRMSWSLNVGNLDRYLCTHVPYSLLTIAKKVETTEMLITE